MKKVLIMRRILFLAFMLIISLDVFAIKAEYVKVKPKSGEGILSIFRRYMIIDSPCDMEKFYKINGLKKESKLFTDRFYKLPIYIYEYNGKSIRSTIGINNLKKAIRIKDYNKYLYSKGIKKGRFTQGEKILWVPYHELYCDEIVDLKPIEPDAKSKKGKRIFPIFGEKHQSTPLLSKKLEGQVFYVVSGHGGPDPGTTANYGSYLLCEDEYAYDVALRICRKLIQHGARAYMITRDENDGIRSGKILPCDKDEKAWKNESIFSRQKPRLLQRSNVINSLYERNKLAGITKQTLLAIHIDSRKVGERTDVFFYYHMNSAAGKKAAYKVHSTLKAKYEKHRKSKEYTGTVTARDLHMLRETKPTSVYIELGNIKNPSDQKRFILESNRELLAKWLFEGFTNFAP